VSRKVVAVVPLPGVTLIGTAMVSVALLPGSNTTKSPDQLKAKTYDEPGASGPESSVLPKTSTLSSMACKPPASDVQATVPPLGTTRVEGVSAEGAPKASSVFGMSLPTTPLPSANQMFPSGPTVMPAGASEGSGYSVMTPEVVICPILPRLPR